MSDHDALAIQAIKLKETLWAYMDEYLNKEFIEEKDNARRYMNSLLDAIDSFVDRPEYK